MPDLYRVACVQMNAGPDIAQNIADVDEMVRVAAAKGARLIATPENTCHIRATQADKLHSASEEKDHPALIQFSALARELKIHLLIGSLSIRISADKLANRSYLIAPDGSVTARYDKIHLFDADLPTGERYRESDVFQPSNKGVVTDLDGFRLGMTVCYDLRFPHLHQALARAGAKMIAVPAAFAATTGKLHWHVLLRARAIETGSFIIAPAQCGTHEGGRKTWGHSLIVDPWGRVLAECQKDQPDVLIADLDLAEVDRVRQAMPVLQHIRPFDVAEM